MIRHDGLREPLECLKDELQYNPTAAVQSISRLRVIGLALGPERTKMELLPYLTAEIQAGNLNYEVLLAIANVLSQFVDFVSTKEDARCLIAPLRELCCIEEAVVRQQAVRTMWSVGHELSAELVSPHIIPMVLALGAQADWHTPRVSACSMLALAVKVSLLDNGNVPVSARTPSLQPAALQAAFDAATASNSSVSVSAWRVGSLSERPVSFCSTGTEGIIAHFAGSESAVAHTCNHEQGASTTIDGSPCTTGGSHDVTSDLLALFAALSHDGSPEVRRAAAASMAPLAEALGSSATITSHLAPAFGALLSDEVEAVRVAALGAAAAIAAAVPLGDGHPAATRLLGASRDKSAAVRIALIEALPGVARADCGAAALAREILTGLVDDPELDVRIAVALQVTALAEGIGAPFVSAVLLPKLDELVRDESVGARVDLAGVLMSLAAPLGAARATTDLLPLIHLLVDDANTNVRAYSVPPQAHASSAPSSYPVWSLFNFAVLEQRYMRVHRCGSLSSTGSVSSCRLWASIAPSMATRGCCWA